MFNVNDSLLIRPLFLLHMLNTEAGSTRTCRGVREGAQSYLRARASTKALLMYHEQGHQQSIITQTPYQCHNFNIPNCTMVLSRYVYVMGGIT